MLMMAMWQGLENDSISAGNTKWLMFFVGLVAVSLLAQAVVVIIAAVGGAKAIKRILAISEELHVRAIPIIKTTEELIRETVPKVRTISNSLVDASQVVKAKVQEFDSTLTDANNKTKAQVARVDSMLSTALTATGALAEMIHQGIKTPVKEAVGVVNGFKAGLNVLLSRSKGFANSASVRRKTAIEIYKDDHSAL